MQIIPRNTWFWTEVTCTISSCSPSQVKLWKLQSPLFSSASSNINIKSFFIMTLQQRRRYYSPGLTALYSFDFECQGLRRKKKIQPPLEYRHSPLLVTADNRNGSGLRVWDLFNGLLLASKIKERKIKKKNKNDASLCRGTRGWDRSMGNLHCTSPRDVKINKHWVESTKLFHQLGSPYVGWLLEVRILSRDSNYNVFSFTIL